MPEQVSSLTIVTAEERAMESQIHDDDISFWGRMSAPAKQKTRRVKFSDLSAAVRATITLVKGDKGDPGKDSTVAGPVGKSAFEVAQSAGFAGNLSAWLASLVGPKGDKGDAGLNSTVPGPDGRSAYAVAVANGFVGTEPQWLASLVGPRGPQGPAGDPNRRTVRVAVPNGLLGINLSQTIIATWPTPFLDTNYSISYCLTAPGLNVATLQVACKGKTAAGVTISVTNVGIALTVSNVTLELTATHD